MSSLLTRAIEYFRPERKVSSKWMWLLLAPVTLQRKSRRTFYDGPACYNYPGRKIKGYRSPNVMISIWLHAGMVMWLTTYGRYFLLLTAVFVLVGMTAVVMPAYILAFGFVSLFVVDSLVGYYFRPRLKVRRDLPTLIAAGQPTTVEYRVTNIGPRSCWGVFVDVLPSPLAKMPDGLAWFRDLAPGTEADAKNEIVFAKRGLAELPVCLAASGFPFGLWRWSSRSSPDAAVHVYPKFTPLVSIDMPVGRVARQGQSIVASSANDSIEFMGIREYHYGDNPRLIHALSSARLQQPVVKEFREEYMTRTALVVDACGPAFGYWHRMFKHGDARLEAICCLAAAVADDLSKRQHLVDFFIVGDQVEEVPTCVPGTRGAGQQDLILKAIAGIGRTETDLFPGLPPDHSRRLDESSSVIAILGHYDDGRRAFLEDLSNKGAGMKAIVVTQPGDELDLPPHSGLVAFAGDEILAGKVQNL